MSATLASRLDELMLLRSLADAYGRFDAQLQAVRRAAVVAGKTVQTLELLCLKAEIDMLHGLWRLRFGARATPANRDAGITWAAMSNAEICERLQTIARDVLSPERARATGLV
jgi:hypothetical protein